MTAASSARLVAMLPDPAARAAVRAHVGADTEASDSLLRSAATPELWALVPLRFPSTVDSARRSVLAARIAALPDTARALLHLLAAAAPLPSTLRADAVAGAAAAIGASLNDLEHVVRVGLLSDLDVSALHCRRTLLDAIESTAALAAARHALADALPDGDHRTRIRARAAVPAHDVPLAGALAAVAARRGAIGDHLEAARDLDLAARLVPERDRGPLLLRAATHLLDARHLDAGLALLDEADRLVVERDLRAESLYQRGKALALRCDPMSGTALQVRGAELLVGRDDERAAVILLNGATTLLSTVEADYARRLLRRAAELAAPGSMTAIAIDVVEGRLLIAQGRLAQAAPYVERTAALAEMVLADHSAATLSEEAEHLLWIELSSKMALERHQEVRDLAHRCISVADRVGLPHLGEFARLHLVLASWADGNLAQARRWIDTVRRLEGDDTAATSPWFDAFEYLVAATTDTDADRSLGAWTTAASERTVWDSVRGIADAMIDTATGDHARVRVALEPVLRSLEDGGCRAFGFTSWLSLLVEAQVRDGAPLEAERTARVQHQWGEESGLDGLRIPALRSAALVATAEQRPAAWSAAIAAHEAWGNPLELAHCLRARAESLAAHGDDRPVGGTRTAAAVSADLVRGRALYERCGARGFARRCSQLLSVSSGRVPVGAGPKRIAGRRDDAARAGDIAPPSTGRSLDLSSSERPVVDLVAEGATNKEIAGKLGLSVKTVEAHLRRLYRRNGIRNRAALVARLRG